METVKDYVKEAIAKGDKIIFIDEITRAEDFISNSSVF